MPNFVEIQWDFKQRVGTQKQVITFNFYSLKIYSYSRICPFLSMNISIYDIF